RQVARHLHVIPADLAAEGRAGGVQHGGGGGVVDLAPGGDAGDRDRRLRDRARRRGGGGSEQIVTGVGAAQGDAADRHGFAGRRVLVGEEAVCRGDGQIVRPLPAVEDRRGGVEVGGDAAVIDPRA